MALHCNHIAVPALVFNGVEIRDRNEMLNLTGAWKAAGSPSGRAPNDWRALSSTVEFADHVAQFLNAGKSGNELFHVKRGGRKPATWAHWQLGIAYAKYLSPEFHMQCNVVIRERLEGKASTISMPNFSDPAAAARAWANEYEARLVAERTNADKRAEVLSMLDAHPEFSDREIARRAGISPQTVNT
ncbi:KilA-N domain-containing protein [Xanthobacter albus]|uniref:KilA-N domain-containing protein n=1 Tax=Xanthobacter albus TaxID=3119929 RepID=UPI00372D3617